MELSKFKRLIGAACRVCGRRQVGRGRNSLGHLVEACGACGSANLRGPSGRVDRFERGRYVGSFDVAESLVGAQGRRTTSSTSRRSPTR